MKLPDSKLLAWDIPLVQKELSKNNFEELIRKDINNEQIMSKEKKAIALIYKAQISNPNNFWGAEPEIPQNKRESYWESFIFFLRKYNLFYKKFPGSNWKVELIFIHAFIPKKHADSFLESVYKLYEELNWEPENINRLPEKDLTTYFKGSLKSFEYMLKNDYLTQRLKNTIKDIFRTWNEETDILSLPDWLVKRVLEFKKEKRIRSLMRRKLLYRDEETGEIYLSEKFDKDFTFFTYDFKEIPYQIKDKKIIIYISPAYVVVKQRLKTSLEDLNIRIISKNDYKIFLLRGQNINNETIGNYLIFAYSSVEDIREIEGEEIHLLKPDFPGLKIYKDKFLLKLNKPEFVNILLETPKGDILTSEDLDVVNEFKEEGLYRVLYEEVSVEGKLNKEGEEFICVLKEIPFLVIKDLKIKYKNKLYNIGDYIDESHCNGFKLKAVISRIENISEIEDKKYEIKILFPKAHRNLRLELYNRCGKLVEVYKNLKEKVLINFGEYPDYIINFPITIKLITSLNINRKIILDQEYIKNGKPKSCAYFALLVNESNVYFGGKSIYEFFETGYYITKKEFAVLRDNLSRHGIKISNEKDLVYRIKNIINNIEDKKSAEIYRELKNNIFFKLVINRNFWYREKSKSGRSS